MPVIVSHLISADDMLIFCKAHEKSFTIINTFLDNLAMNTGLTINRGKSKLFLSKGCKEKEQLADLLQIPIGSLPVRYLGLPLSHNYLKAEDCIPLIDKFRSNIEGWMGKLLSLSGRVELICTQWSAWFLDSNFQNTSVSM